MFKSGAFSESAFIAVTVMSKGAFGFLIPLTLGSPMAFGNLLRIETLSPAQSCVPSLEPDVSRINMDFSDEGKACAFAEFTPDEEIMNSNEKERMPALRLKPDENTTIPLLVSQNDI